MKSKLFLLLITSFMLVGCTNAANEASSEKSQEESQSEGSQGSDTSSQSSDESSESSGGAEGERTFKAQFYSVNDGTAVTGNSDNSAYTTTVQSYFLDDEQQLLTNASSPEG